MLLVNVELFVPTLFPFTFHWYVGLFPPPVMVAVKVTDTPAQILLPGFAAIVHVGTTLGLTTIVMLDELALVDAGQVSSEVITQLITSPLAKLLLLNVLLLVPTLLPLRFH